jgi:hypothetical protein
VVKGEIELTLYDTDDSIIYVTTLKEGDAMFTLHGGHAFKCLEDSLIYEVKTGPYRGIENDKIFING